MSDKELEKKVDDLFAKLTPDYAESMLKDIDTVQKPAGKKRNLKNLWLRVGSIAAVFVLVTVGIVAAVNFTRYNKIDTTVTLDVNPSIELRVNRYDRVLRVTPLNADGEKVIGTMRLKNVDLDVAVNALIGSMMKNGYLSEMSNSILVTVDGSDAARSNALTERISSDIEAQLNAGFTGSVLSQTVQHDAALQSLADEHSITVGKAQLIQALVSRNPLYSFDALSKLSINELNVLLAKEPVNTDAIHTSGSASTSAYIGEEQALSIACLYVGLEPSEVTLTEAIELEYENGKMVYDVEFRKDDCKYEFDIDAVTGEIVSFGQKQKPSGEPVTPPVTPAPPAADIGQERAVAIALSHANVPQNEAVIRKIEKESDNGVTYYEIEFIDSAFEYEYKVNAATGAIIKADKERDDDAPGTHSEAPEHSAELIGEAKAKEIALRHAGFSAGAVKKLKCELDREKGKLVYEVEFEANGIEYEYTVDAETGEIVKIEKEDDRKDIDDDDDDDFDDDD